MGLFIIGYILAILFPIPLVSSGIIGLWGKLGAEIASWTKSSSTTSTPTPTTPMPPP